MAQRYASSKYVEALAGGGLTSAQAALYEALVQYGPLTVRRASFLAGIPRTLAYKILDELQSIELVTKNDLPKGVATFVASSPLKLKDIADKRFEVAQNAKKSFDIAIISLFTEYNKLATQPNIEILQDAPTLFALLDRKLAGQKLRLAKITENGSKELTFSVILE